MFNKFSWNTLFVCLTATFISSTAITHANTVVITETYHFDPHHHVKIIKADSKVTSPTFWNEHWQVRNSFHFDNGLYGVRNTSWKHETEALLIAEQPAPKKVNIVPSKDSEFLVLDENSIPVIMELWVDYLHPFEKLPYIVAIIETEEDIHHWLSADQRKYRYTIELSDGTVWLKEGTEKWKHDWVQGGEIIRIGTYVNPILINKTRVLYKEHHKVEKNDVLKVQLLR